MKVMHEIGIFAFKIPRLKLWQGVALAGLLLAFSGCGGNDLLRAKMVERNDELIGGPSAKAKIGDFLLENDKIRAIIGGPGPGYAAGVFGGTVLDIDLRRFEAEYRNGKGWDSFSESFPLANLLVVNPSNPTEAIKLDPEGITVDFTNGGVFVLKDGSDGQEAVVRVTGHSAYMFDVMKFLNRDFLDKLLEKLSLGGIELDAGQLNDMLPIVLGMDVNLFGLLNRLQLNFDFVTDYSVRPGESFLRQKTKVVLSAPSNKLLGGCAPVVCDKECEFGYVFAEVDEKVGDYSKPYKRMCPICECANETKDMATFNESRDFFKVLLGQPESWEEPTWKGGIVAGDFLFFGSEAQPFLPGFGHDIDRKIYENMWQGVGTMGSPIVADWIAAIGKNVSYAWTTVNPQETNLCDSYRIAAVRADPASEEEISAALTGNSKLDLAKNLAERDAASRVRQLVVDRKPLFLTAITKDVPTKADALASWRKQVLEEQVGVLETATGLKVFSADEYGRAITNPEGGFAIDLFPEHKCMPSKVMIPLYSTSATAVLTHFTEGDVLEADSGGHKAVDRNRSFKYERILAVGDGDVASAVASVYEVRGTPVGTLKGVVLEEGSMNPASHISVFVVNDYREKQGDPLPANWAEYRMAALEAYGNSGFVTQFQSDVGINRSIDGSFKGPVPPGRYLVFAHASDRGQSAFQPVEVTVDGTANVALVVPSAGKVEYFITDEGGVASPGRLSFQSLDAEGEVHWWTGSNEPELGDSRYDHGVTRVEHSATGQGTVSLPPGNYRVVVSRGFEYDNYVVDNFEVIGGQASTLRAHLIREVDTTGRISADLHVHSRASVDSAMDEFDRVYSVLAEGLEYITATDHDHIVDYMPYIYEKGLEGFLQVTPSAEVSPLEYGHFNAYPLKYDHRKASVHGAPQWQGRTMREIWDVARATLDGPEDAYVFQVNHPRDGFLGYFAQIGMKGYSLQRKTPGMEMCNQALAESPCDFDAMEILNGKNLQYIHTPTVGEVERHNRCYREIVRMRGDPSALSFKKNGQDAVCGWFQADPYDCEEVANKVANPKLPEDERGQWMIKLDHCQWHAEFRAELEHCADGIPDGWTAVDCKRAALEGLKFLGVRYMMERTQDENDVYFSTTEETDIGCKHKDACLECVKPIMPACDDKWTTECVITCRDECPLDDMRPCTDRMEMVQDWFHFLDVGFNKTIVGNSDSHGSSKEIGSPRNFVASSTDKPNAIDRDEIHRNIKRGDVVVSGGPYIEFSLVDKATERKAGISDTLESSGPILAHVKVQTPSWFKVDRVEIWSNSQLVKRFFPDKPVEAIVDFDEVIELQQPDIDSWYVVLAYGVSADSSMSPAYKRAAYGDILVTTIIGLALDQVLASFGSLVDKVGSFLGDLDSLTGSIELPDSYPSLPWGATNPILVDVDGDGYRPPRAVDANGDGVWDPPAFCSKECDPADENPCGDYQVCAPRPKRPNDKGPDVYVCWIPTPEHCVGLQPVAGADEF